MNETQSQSLMTFDEVIPDYLFFQQHITEITEMKRHFREHLLKMNFSNHPIQYLDFGCGDATISVDLEQQVGNLTGKTQFSIVEPTVAQRTVAVDNLKKVSNWPVTAYEYLPEQNQKFYDFILASHSLYYVPDLKKTIKSLYENLNPNSLFIIAMECSDSPTKKIWEIFFNSIGMAIPYHLPEAVKKVLAELKIPYVIDPLKAQMEFPDTTKNRRHIARFLLEPYYRLKPQEEILSFFDTFSSSGVIRADLGNDLFIIRS